MIEFIEDVLKERDSHEYHSYQWHNCNKEKVFIIEDLKPEWKEYVAYYSEHSLDNIPYGFTKTNELPSAHIYENKRSILEYNGGYTRQIIPYCLVRCDDEYYLVLRENNGDNRLNGGIGLLGGHVGKDIEGGMLRELEEEANITTENIESVNLIGTIKSNDTITDMDHLGLVYIIELKHKRIRMQEYGIQKGMFVKLGDFHKYSPQFESWLELISLDLFSS